MHACTPGSATLEHASEISGGFVHPITFPPLNLLQMINTVLKRVGQQILVRHFLVSLQHAGTTLFWVSLHLIAVPGL